MDYDFIDYDKVIYKSLLDSLPKKGDTGTTLPKSFKASTTPLEVLSFKQQAGSLLGIKTWILPTLMGPVTSQSLLYSLSTHYMHLHELLSYGWEKPHSILHKSVLQSTKRHLLLFCLAQKSPDSTSHFSCIKHRCPLQCQMSGNLGSFLQLYNNI